MATILIIDDKPGVRQLLAEELAFQGYTVMTIGNVALVDEIIRFSSFDLVIMDLYMKGQHRWDLFSDIKHQDPHLPVLIVTDFASYRKDPVQPWPQGFWSRVLIWTTSSRRLPKFSSGRDPIRTAKHQTGDRPPSPALFAPKAAQHRCSCGSGRIR